MSSAFRYSESESDDLLRQHSLVNLSTEQKLSMLLDYDTDKDIYEILVIDLAYHKNPELIAKLIEKVGEQDQNIARTASNVLATIHSEDAIPTWTALLQKGVPAWEHDYAERALANIASDTVINEIRRNINDPNFSLLRAEKILKHIHSRPSEYVTDSTKENARQLLNEIAAKSGASVGYLFTWDEITFIADLVGDPPNSRYRRDSVGAYTIFDSTYAAIRDFDIEYLGEDYGSIEHLIFHLGVVTHYRTAPEGVGFSAPYQSIGSRLWENYRKQIRDIFCEDTEAYKAEREKLKSMTEGSLIILVPIIMSVLSIPPEMAGIAVVLSLIVLKMGLKTLCATSGDARLLKGKPGDICKASGRYANVRAGLISEIQTGTSFPEGPTDSEWFFVEEIPQ